MIGRLREMTLNRDGSQNITVTIYGEDFAERFDRMKDKELDIEIKPHRNRRSKDANAFCWSLCSLIGNAMKPPIPKEEVYRKAIRDVGRYIPMPIRDDAVEYWMRVWSNNGTGWFAERVDASKIPGYSLIFSYVGSSQYDTAEMSRLIEYLKDDCEQMGLAIPLSKKEEEELLQQWGSK